jgi:hypothetical protein
VRSCGLHVYLNPEHGTTQQPNGQYVDRVARFPVPTSDPADPLNWETWRKISCLGTVSLYAFVCNFVSASITPVLPIWNLSFPQDPRPFDDLMRFVAVSSVILWLQNPKKTDNISSMFSCSALAISFGCRSPTSLVEDQLLSYQPWFCLFPRPVGRSSQISIACLPSAPSKALAAQCRKPLQSRSLETCSSFMNGAPRWYVLRYQQENQIF